MVLGACRIWYLLTDSIPATVNGICRRSAYRRQILTGTYFIKSCETQDVKAFIEVRRSEA